jgi:hypothetical protein
MSSWRACDADSAKLTLTCFGGSIEGCDGTIALSASSRPTARS